MTLTHQKKKDVTDALNDDDMVNWSNVRLSRLCNVSTATIAEYRNKLGRSPKIREFVTKGGRLARINVDGLGRQKGCDNSRRRVLQRKNFKPVGTLAEMTIRDNWAQQYKELSARYEALDNRYSELADKHREMAKKADQHRNAEMKLQDEVEHLRQASAERLVALHQQRGIISYLEQKIAQLED